MAKYFDTTSLAVMNQARLRIFAERAAIWKQYQVDILDTDALSALSIFEIVCQYDPNYNINFSRNGEDAKSNGMLIEQKASKVKGHLTGTGKPRKGADSDAAFQFHAMGDLDYPRYIFVARNQDDLTILRIYDIAQPYNRSLILNHLMAERQAWLVRSQANLAKMKRDIIILPEKFILSQIKLDKPVTIDKCRVFRDWI